jgi:hypothetical protein
VDRSFTLGTCMTFWRRFAGVQNLSAGHWSRAGRAMLAGIYGSFTKDFDTADLKDAKALLENFSDRNA